MTYYLTQAGANYLNEVESKIAEGILPNPTLIEEDFLLFKIANSPGERLSEAGLTRLGYIGSFNLGLLSKLQNKGYVTTRK